MHQNGAFFIIRNNNYLIIPNPSKNTQATNIRATIAVNLFNPFSALFWDVNICAALPIPAMPSPFGECIRISTINNNADKTINIHKKLSILSPF